MHQTRNSCRFVFDMSIMMEISKDFLKFIDCKSGITGQDLYNEFTKALSIFGLDLKIVVVKVMIVLVLFLAMLMDFQS